MMFKKNWRKGLVLTAVALMALAVLGCSTDLEKGPPAPPTVYEDWQQIADTGFTDYFGTTKLSGVAYGNNRWVIVGDGKAAWSTTGVYWNGSAGGTGVAYYSSACNALTFVNGKFYTFGENSEGKPYIVSSPDGNVWTEVTQYVFTDVGDYIWDIAYGKKTYVMVADGGSTFIHNKIAYSTDLVNWNIAASGTDVFTSSPVYQIEFAEGLFVAVGGPSSGGKAAWSSNGKDWTGVNFGGGTQSRGLAYGNGKFVSVGRASANQVKVSEDGKNWAAYTLSWSQYINGITFGDGKFLIGGGSAQAKISETADADADWAAVPQLGSIFTSSNWINATAWGNRRFIAVGDNGRAAFSTN